MVASSANFLPGTAISTYSVQDKKQVAEFDVQQWLAQNPDHDEEESNPCPICNSAEREDILLLCDSCDAAYHTHCIGLDAIPEGDWYCMECTHLFGLVHNSASETNPSPAAARSPRPRADGRLAPRETRGHHVRTRARLRRARRQARNAEWQGAWGQFSGRFYEMSELDLDNHDDDEDLEQYRRFQQLDRRELQRWQQRMEIANRLGARDEFASNIPPQISERLQPAGPPIEESTDERRAWGALDRAREAEGIDGGSRRRRPRSVTASPAEPTQEPERKLKRPRTRRLPTQGEASISVSTVYSGPVPPLLPSPGGSGSSTGPQSRNGLNRRNHETPLVSSLLKELEPNAPHEDETTTPVSVWRPAPEASSPALSPCASNHSSPRALSLTPPPLPRVNGRESSPTLSLSTHIEPKYGPANYSPSRPTSDQSDSETRQLRIEPRSLELRRPRSRRQNEAMRQRPRTDNSSPTRMVMTQEEKKNINDIVKTALRPHWRAQKLTTAQYETINRDVSRRLYDEVKDASSLDDEARRSWEKRAAQEVAQAVAELPA